MPSFSQRRKVVMDTPSTLLDKSRSVSKKHFHPSAAPLFVSLAPYFFNAAGHELPYHTELQKAMRSHGFRVQSLAPLSCRVSPLSSEWIPYFHHSPHKFIRFLYRLFDVLRLLRTLRTHHPSAILFLESYALLDLFALICIFICLPTSSLQLWQVVRDGLEGSPRRQALHQRCIQFFYRKFPKRYRLFSDSLQVIRSLQPLSPIPFIHLPIPHTTPLSSAPPTKDPITLWLPGTPRPEKGLQEILHLFSSHDPELHRLQLWSAYTPLFAPLRHSARWTPPHLSRKDYLHTLAITHALLLPYDPHYYRSRTSGPFVEAIIAGKIVFVREGSWLAMELHRYHLSECIIEWNHPLAPSHIIALIQNPTVHAKFRAMCMAYRQFHSPTTFAHKLYPNRT